MSNTILLKKSGTAAAVPNAGDLALGELAINYADGNLFYKNGSNQVKVIASNQFVSVAGNVTAGNILTSGLVSAQGNVTGNYILGNGALLTGVITSVANITGFDNLSNGTTSILSDGKIEGTTTVTGSGCLTSNGSLHDLYAQSGSSVSINLTGGTVTGVQSQITLGDNVWSGFSVPQSPIFTVSQ